MTSNDPFPAFLSIEGNPQICRQQPCEEGPKSGKQKRVIIAAAAAAALVALISFSGFIMIKRKRKPSGEDLPSA